MRLDELTGVKRYRDRSLHDALWDFTRAGGEVLGVGRFGTVITHPSWDHVYKFFAHDDGYLRFVRWVLKNPDPAFPRFLSKPKRIVPFFKRHRREPYLYVVKIERLLPLHDPLRGSIADLIHGWRSIRDQIGTPEADALVRRYHEADARYRSLRGPERRAALDDVLEVRHLAQRIETYQQAIALNPSLPHLCDAYWDKFLTARFPDADDIHGDNVMQRPDGTLVLTDPLWHGETPYTLHDAMLRAEMAFVDDEEPPESDFLPGGVEHLPRKRRKPKPPRWVPPSDAEIPF